VPTNSLPMNAAAQAETMSTPNSITPLGCYSQGEPLESQGDYVFQSRGYCRAVCRRLNKPVMATTGGTTCYCGDGFPALDSEVDMRHCNVSCAGYSLETCGGVGFWQVYLIGWADRDVGDLRQQWQQG
jgi:cell wall integrity and stress response component